MAKFEHGQIVVTSGVNERISNDNGFALHINRCLTRHLSGDWGDLCKEDREENELSLEKGFRLFSSYKHDSCPKIWIITEADRSVTTVLFPSEY